MTLLPISSLKLNVSAGHARNDMPRRARRALLLAHESAGAKASDATMRDAFHNVVNGLTGILAPATRPIAAPKNPADLPHSRRQCAKETTRPVTHKHTGNLTAQ